MTMMSELLGALSPISPIGIYQGYDNDDTMEINNITVVSYLDDVGDIDHLPYR